MRKQIMKLDDLVGCTIEGFGKVHAKLIVLLNDGRFVGLKNGWEDCAPEVSDDLVDPGAYSARDWERVGVLTKEEAAAILQAAEERNAANIERREREELARLKRKYEQV